MTAITADLSPSSARPGAAHDSKASPSRRALWAGRACSGLATLFLAFDGVFKLAAPDVVVESFEQLGYPPNIAVPIGVILLVGVALYVVRRTSLLGAIYLTGYLGGAVATHVRVGDPLLSHTVFPIYFIALLWLGLWLRDTRVRAAFASTPAA